MMAAKKSNVVRHPAAGRAAEPWVRPADGVDLIERDTMQAGVKGARVMLPWERLYRNKQLTSAEARAAQFFNADWHEAFAEASPATLDWAELMARGCDIDKSINAAFEVPVRESTKRMHARINVASIFERAGHSGAEVLAYIVGMEWPLNRYAEKIGGNNQIAKGLLKGGLSTAAAYYRLEE